jgi:hypothetical protein
VLVFDRVTHKYVQINNDCQVIYVDAGHATVFTNKSLRAAHEFFEDFSIYKRNLLAVPVGTNKLPVECNTVATYLAEQREQENEHGNNTKW